MRRRPGFLGHHVPVGSLGLARRASVDISDHLLFHTLAVEGPDVSAKLMGKDEMEEEIIVRCDLRILHVTRAQADVIVIVIVSVGLGTMVAPGCAIRRGAGSGTGPRFGSEIPVHEQSKGNVDIGTGARLTH